MKYINSKDFKLNNTVVTLGKFDGFHKGHMKLIESLSEYKEEFNTVVFTFDISPLKILGIHNDYILSKEERIYIYDKLDVDVVIEFPFNEHVMKMPAMQFIEDILVKKLDVKKIIVGSDYHFGYKRQGDVELLKEMSNVYGYELQVLDKLDYQDEAVSSTRIKYSIKKGKMSNVSDMLGYNYFIKSKVIDGKHLGRKLGFPTINQNIDKNKIVPPKGVYVSKVMVDSKCYYGITNIGNAPTVEDDCDVKAETNIFDFEDMIYGKEALVELLTFVREEKKFINVEELKKQIIKDIEIAKNYLEENGDDESEFAY